MGWVPSRDRHDQDEILAMSVTAKELSGRLSAVSVRTRADLEFSRHVVSGEPSYVVHDPISFVAHSLGREEYDVFVSIDTSETLGETFKDLVERGVLEENQETEYYEYVLGLHRLDLLILPISDDKALFERYEKKRSAARRSKLLGFMFLRVPMWNPDSFLKRTLPLARCVFSIPFFIVYACLIVASLFSAIHRSDDLTAPLLGMLDLQNVWLLWSVLIVNKVFHEFGHAYACRVLGGKVPEMGAFFIMFTPCAYVDASASWSFSSRWRRMVVNLGGVYFESILAIAGLWVWLLTEPGLINTMAYQVLVMASVVTVLFNLNPLAKFDGYYVLSDLVNIPNLRQRANEQLSNVFCKVALGVSREPSPYGPMTRFGLTVFAIASSIYRVVLVLTLSVMIASKMFLFGVLLAVLFVGMTVFGALTKAVRLFLMSEEAARSRVRATLVGLGLLCGAPALLAFTPVPRPVEAVGVLERTAVRVLRAEVSGVIDSIPAREGRTLSEGDEILRLENLELSGAYASSVARLQASQIDLNLAESEPSQYRRAEQLFEQALADEHFAKQQLDALAIEMPFDGSVISWSEDVRTKSSVQAGDEIGLVAGGGWVAVLYEDDAISADASPEVDQEVWVRLSSDPEEILHGYVISVAPVGSTTLRHTAVTQAGGGSIPVHPYTGEASKAYIEIRVALDIPAHKELTFGTRLVARFDPKVEAVGDVLVRRFLRFVETLRTQ